MALLLWFAVTVPAGRTRRARRFRRCWIYAVSPACGGCILSAGPAAVWRAWVESLAEALSRPAVRTHARRARTTERRRRRSAAAATAAGTSAPTCGWSNSVDPTGSLSFPFACLTAVMSSRMDIPCDTLRVTPPALARRARRCCHGCCPERGCTHKQSLSSIPGNRVVVGLLVHLPPPGAPAAALVAHVRPQCLKVPETGFTLHQSLPSQAISQNCRWQSSYGGGRLCNHHITSGVGEPGPRRLPGSAPCPAGGAPRPPPIGATGVTGVTTGAWVSSSDTGLAMPFVTSV